MARHDRGYFKLWRTLLDSDIGTNTKCLAVMIHLLGMANVQESWAKRPGAPAKVPRGSLVTSLCELSRRTGLSVQNVRTVLTYLEKRETINTQSDKHGTFITIRKYGVYQDKPEQANTPINTRPTHAQQSNEELRREEGAGRKISPGLKQEIRFRMAKEIQAIESSLASMYDGVIPATIKNQIPEMIFASSGDAKCVQTALEDLFQSPKIRGEGLTGSRSSYVTAALIERFSLLGSAS